MSNNLRFSSITDMFNKQAKDRPDHVCLYYPDQAEPHTYATLTYKQFNDVTNHLAQKYSQVIGENQRNETPIIGLLANTSVDYLLTMYALLKLDVIVFPLSIRNSEAAIMHLLEKSNVSHLFYSDEYSSMSVKAAIKFDSTINLYQMETIRIIELTKCGESTFKLKMDSDQLDQIRIIFHSSGSTAFPKPIRMSIRYLFGYYESYVREMNNRFWSDEDVVLSVMPLFHIAGMSMTIIQWYVGGTYAMSLTPVFPPSPKELFANIQYPKITKLHVVPLFLEQLIPLLRQNDNRGFQILTRFQFVASTGAACSPYICKELAEHGVNLVILLGTTEIGYVLTSEYDMTDKNQWQKLRPLEVRKPYLNFEPIESGSNVYELGVLSSDPYLAPDLAVNGGFYSVSDLFIENPPGSNSFVIQGRKDDILVHTTGEKTNPLPIELAIRQHPIVEHTVVLGHQYLFCSALIQLNIEEAFKFELREIERQVFTAVEAANKDAPSHSHIVPALIKILPMSKQLPITNKGNVIRKQVDLEYGTIVKQMYDQFLNGAETTDFPRRSWTRDAICSYLKTTVAQILHKPVEIFTDYSKSLYSLALDSLTAVELRNILCHEFGQLEQSIVFEYSNINALASELLRIITKEEVRTLDDPQHYKETEEIIDKYIELMKAHQDERNAISEKRPSDHTSNSGDKRVVLITGANGSLGSHILLQLLNKPQVRRVYCLLRGENPVDRLRRAMQARKQDSAVLLDTTRVIVLPMDLTKDTLGQTAAMYEQLQHEVTDIIHSAWRMDFNMTIKDFDWESLQGLYDLLKLASSSSTQVPMQFHFISSVSAAGSGLIDPVKEEPLPRQMGIALAQGYGQSKYAGEHICWAATDFWGVPINIYRLTQISGDSKTGVWNTAEMIPLMICAGGSQLGILPENGQNIDWIPVNYAAACIADIAMDASIRAAPRSERVHHIVNPHIISWSQLLEYLKSSGLQFKTVPIKEWLLQLLASPDNPAYTLADFFQKIFAEGKSFELAKYNIEKTIRRTATLEHCPPVNQELIHRYLNYWSEVAFLKHGYTPTI